MKNRKPNVSLLIVKFAYYYERHTFLINDDYCVDMVALTSKEYEQREANEQVTIRHNLLSSYSEEIPISTLPTDILEDLLIKHSIEKTIWIYKDEYDRVSHLKEKELFSIDPTSFKNY